MIIQETKKVIDVGEIGNASTGDILFDGGNKINNNFDSVYNAFGDQRLAASDQGADQQLIHATGYWQKVSQIDFKTPIALGTQWDVDTSTGGASPIITQGKPGECVQFINSNGSWSVNNPLVISLSNGSFIGVQGSLTITSPFTKVTCWCVSNIGGVISWNYAVEAMYGDTALPINGTYSVTSVQAKIRIAHASEFNGIKLLLSGSNANNSKMRQSEVNILIDNPNKKIYYTEFGVIRVGATDEEDEIINISFEIDANGFVNAVVTTQVVGFKLAIKSIVTQKIGAA